MWWIVVQTGEGWWGVYSGLCEQYNVKLCYLKERVKLGVFMSLHNCTVGIHLYLTSRGLSAIHKHN